MAKHIIRLEDIFIIKAFSTDFEQPIEGDIIVEEDGGRHFNLDLIDERGLPTKKYVDGEILDATEADLAVKTAEYEASLPNPNLTQIDINLSLIAENKELRARVDVLEGK